MKGCSNQEVSVDWKERNGPERGGLQADYGVNSQESFQAHGQEGDWEQSAWIYLRVKCACSA